METLVVGVYVRKRDMFSDNFSQIIDYLFIRGMLGDVMRCDRFNVNVLRIEGLGEIPLGADGETDEDNVRDVIHTSHLC